LVVGVEHKRGSGFYLQRAVTVGAVQLMTAFAVKLKKLMILYVYFKVTKRTQWIDVLAVVAEVIDG
jgi:hypothetical protein